MQEYIIELSSDDENALSIIAKAYNLHELIRCKYCKHATMTSDGKMCKYCAMDTDDFGDQREVYHDADWFCADGERRDETNE